MQQGLPALRTSFKGGVEEAVWEETSLPAAVRASSPSAALAFPWHRAAQPAPRMLSQQAGVAGRWLWEQRYVPGPAGAELCGYS